MNGKGLVSAAVAVMAMGLSGSVMAAPLLTGLDGTLDSSLFTYKYEGDVLPQNAGLGFALVDPNGVYGTSSDPASLGNSGGVNYLTIKTDTNDTVTANQYGDIYNYQLMGGSGTNWDPHFLGGFTVEFRVIVRANNSGTYGAAVRVQDENSSGLFQFWRDKMSGDLASVATAPNDDALHTFRIASYSPDGSSAGQVYKVWRDGTEIGTFAQNANYAGSLLVFGDYVSGIGEVDFDIDYLRWTTDGAYAPVPEPSSAAMLLMLGGGLLFRRRKGLAQH
ncbi:MAG: PEP-CTERM sorting domain-containing protein [Phycisphaerales bacterium]|nr:PEP-CTERM sorting domain-containing protein [Phycisphaerales bacterium]